MTFGLLEIGILLFVVFLIFGPRRIQNVLGALGRGVEDFVNESGQDKGEEKMLGGGDEEDRK